MRWRTALTLLAAGLALTAVSAGVAVYRTHARAQAARQERLVPVRMREVVSFIRRVPGAGEVSCRRDKDGTWWVDAPFRDLASQGVIEELAALVEYGRGEPVPAVDTPAFDAPEATLILRTSEQEVSVDFAQAEDEDTVFARVSEAPDRVYALDPELARAALRPAAAYRSLQLFPRGLEQAQALTLEGVPGGTVLLRRGAKGWTLRAPVAWPADAPRVDKLLRRCATLRATGVIAQGPQARLPEETEGTVLVRAELPEAAAQVRLAPPEPGQEHGRAWVVDRDVLFAVPDRLRSVLARRPVDQYRRHRLDLLASLDLPEALRARTKPEDRLGYLVERISEIRLEHPGQRVRLVHGAMHWQATAPERFPVDRQVLTALVRTLRDLEAQDFAPEAQASAHELDDPFLVARVFDETGTEAAVLRVGARTDRGTRFAATGARSAVFTLSARDVAVLSQPWPQFHERRLCAVHPKHPVRLSVFRNGTETRYRRARGDSWQMVLPKTLPVDNWAFYTGPLSQQGFGGLKAVAVAAPAAGDLARFGLDPPRLRVVLEYASPEQAQRQQTSTFTLAIGGPAKHHGEEARYARVPGSKVVVVVPGEFVDMLEKDYTDPSLLE